MRNSNKTSKLKYTLYLIFKVMLLTVASIFFYSNMDEFEYALKHQIRFIEFLQSIAFLLLVVGEVAFDIFTLIGKKSMFKHVPAVLALDCNKIGRVKEKLSRFGVVWNSIKGFAIVSTIVLLTLRAYATVYKGLLKADYGYMSCSLVIIIVFVILLLMMLKKCYCLFKIKST